LNEYDIRRRYQHLKSNVDKMKLGLATVRENRTEISSKVRDAISTRLESSSLNKMDLLRGKAKTLVTQMKELLGKLLSALSLGDKPSQKVADDIFQNMKAKRIEIENVTEMCASSKTQAANVTLSSLSQIGVITLEIRKQRDTLSGLEKVSSELEEQLKSLYPLMSYSDNYKSAVEEIERRRTFYNRKSTGVESCIKFFKKLVEIESANRNTFNELYSSDPIIKEVMPFLLRDVNVTEPKILHSNKEEGSYLPLINSNLKLSEKKKESSGDLLADDFFFIQYRDNKDLNSRISELENENLVLAKNLTKTQAKLKQVKSIKGTESKDVNLSNETIKKLSSELREKDSKILALEKQVKESKDEIDIVKKEKYISDKKLEVVKAGNDQTELVQLVEQLLRKQAEDEEEIRSLKSQLGSK